MRSWNSARGARGVASRPLLALALLLAPLAAAPSLAHAGERTPGSKPLPERTFGRSRPADARVFRFCNGAEPEALDPALMTAQPDGRIGPVFGTYGSGAGKLNGPRALAVDGEGHLHVAEAGNARVQVFSTDGQVVRSYTSDALVFPRAIAIDPAGFSYVADPSAGAIHVFDTAGAPVKRFEALTLGGRPVTPLDLTWRRGELYVRVA